MHICCIYVTIHYELINETIAAYLLSAFSFLSREFIFRGGIPVNEFQE